ncbi:glycoside hydrolase family 76 protein [Flavivirga sp. 57AJ16]|uniref:glycoside hydrolase family 76 protein n=1 Tax=Flavivirga sp. 57AJ16 TaxID=3025307 RepID=UPI002366815D|nr:glycoside hydrolase family 76 protein [Flavivirga sp. 57AJ16]MDD7888151.1 glycoside hydrolase family 76 protein [Flavivirga sp. 57AJ16]
MNKRKIDNPILVILGLLFVVSCSVDPRPLRDVNNNDDQFQYDWSATADSIQDATYTQFLGSQGTFTANNAGDNTFHYWPNGHALHILVDGYVRTGDASYVSKMKALLNGIKSKNGNTYVNVFNDDMLWLANACVRAYVATNDSEYKDVAEFLWTEILKSHSDVFGGGITWKKDTPKSKNAVSNGPTIVLAMRLYDLEGNTEYLDWAKNIYEWQKNTLVDPATGLVWDNISETDGVVTTNKDWIFTYNMGTWIGAGIRLYQETGEEDYLFNALKSAKSLMTSSKLTTEGLLRDEGEGDGGLFKGILVRYFTELILLPDLNTNDRNAFLKFFKFNVETFHAKGLSKPNMMSGHNWKVAPTGKVDLTTQLSGVMLIEAAARLEAADLL